MDTAALARLLGARVISVPEQLLRAGAAATWRMHLQPTPPGWLDLARSCPVMDCGRADRQLGWRPAFSATEAVAELLRGLREAQGEPTPALDESAGGPARLGELATGLGSSQDL